MNWQTSFWPGLGSSADLTGAGKPVSKMVRSHDLQAGPECGWEASALHHVGISRGLLCVLTAGQLAGDPRESNAEATRSSMSFSGNVYIVISSVFYW